MLEEIEKLGFRVIATRKFADGVSYDAHFPGSSKLVKGPKMATGDDALAALLVKCGG